MQLVWKRAGWRPAAEFCTPGYIQNCGCGCYPTTQGWLDGADRGGHVCVCADSNERAGNHIFAALSVAMCLGHVQVALGKSPRFLT